MIDDVLMNLDDWRRRGARFATATVVETWGSAPRPVGSKLAVAQDGVMVGSVSAGCVEGAVFEACQAALESGRPELLTYGVADETAWEVGLMCGGTIRVFVEPDSAWQSVYTGLSELLKQRRPLAVVHVLEGPPELLNRKLLVREDGATSGDLQLPLQEGVVQQALDGLANDTSTILQLEDGVCLFLEAYPRPPRLIVIGAVHIAQPLVEIAAQAGFDTLVVDPRAAFATRQRFPNASQLVRKWPQQALPELQLDRSAYVVSLTHDAKIDDPALQLALRSQARYVGALGSRRTNQLRRERLSQAGFTGEELARLHAPVGLDIGGRTPAEIAVSIVAEMIQVRNAKAPLKPQKN